MRTIETKYAKITFEDTEEIKNAVFEALIAWYKNVEHFEGETIFQSDEGQLGAVEIVSDIADEIIKFNIECTDNW